MFSFVDSLKSERTREATALSVISCEILGRSLTLGLPSLMWTSDTDTSFRVPELSEMKRVTQPQHVRLREPTKWYLFKNTALHQPTR